MKVPAPTRETIILLCGLSLSIFIQGCRTAQPDASSKKTPPSTVHTETTPSEALAHFGMGMLDELDANVEGATTNFLQAIEADPDNEELYWLTAERLTVQSRKKEAMEVFDLLIKRKPKSQTGYLWKGWLLQTMQETDQAELQYRKASKIAPKHPGSYMRLAHLLTTQKKWDDAAKVLETATRKVKEPLRAYERLGQIYQQQAKAEQEDSKAFQKSTKHAIQTYQRALKKYKDNRVFLYQLGILQARTGNATKALDLLTQFESVTPNSLALKDELTRTIEKALGGGTNAIQKLETYLNHHPNNPQVAYYLAGIYEATGHSKKALTYYAQSATQNPDDSAPIWKQSLLLVRQTNLTQAVSVLNKGLSTLPEDLHLLEMLAFVELQRTNFLAAVTAFETVETKLLKQGKQNNMQNLWMNYAIAAQQLGDLDLAAKKILQAIKVDPDALPNFAHRIFRQTDQRKVLSDGIAIYTQIAEALPSNPYAKYHLALFYNYSGQFKKTATAFRDAEEIIQETSDATELLNAYFYFLYAAATERTGDFREAEALFFECLEKDPEHAEAYNYLSYMWAENNNRKKLKKALKYINKGLALDPDNGAYLDTKGWILYQQGNYEEALTYLEKANTLMPDDPTITEHVGDALSKLERPDEAKTHWEKALKNNPENKSLQQKMSAETKRELAETPPPTPTKSHPIEESDDPENDAFLERLETIPVDESRAAPK